MTVVRLHLDELNLTMYEAPRRWVGRIGQWMGEFYTGLWMLIVDIDLEMMENIYIYILDIMMMENCQLRDITDDECKDNNCWDNWTPERMVIFGSLYSSLPFNNDFVHPTVVPPFGVRLVRVWLEEFLGGFGNQSEDPDWSALCHCYFQESSQIMHMP